MGLFDIRERCMTTNSGKDSDFPLGDQLLVLFELSVETHDTLVANGPELLAHLADEELIMGHDDDASLEAVQRVGERADGL